MFHGNKDERIEWGCTFRYLNFIAKSGETAILWFIIGTGFICMFTVCAVFLVSMKQD